MVAPIVVNGFGGRVPVLGSRLLQNGQAQLATNCKLLSGELRSWRRGLKTFTPSVTGTLQSLYRMYNGSTDYWLSWADVVDAVKGPIAGDTAFRLYYTGSGFAPRKTNLALATGGTDYPHDYLEMGIPAPAAAPSIVVVGGAAANVTRGYCYTYVSTWDEEGPPSAVTSFTGRPDGSWNLTALSAAPAGKYSINRIRIYRTLTGSTGITNYQLVVEQAVATGSYSDTIADSALGVICPSFENGIVNSAWVAPPTDMHSLVNLPNGMMAGASKNILCFCEPNRPHAWPARYQLAMNNTIVGLGVYGNSVVVCTKGFPEVYSGSHPSSMGGGIVRYPAPCVSKRGIVSFDLFGVAYPSDKGLIVIGSGGAKNATEEFMSRDEWQTFMPDTMMACAYNDKYFAIFNTGTNQGGGVIIDRASQAAPVVDLSLYGTGLHTDIENGKLYYISSNLVYQWDADTINNMPFDWKSKTFALPKPVNFGAAQVDAEYSQENDAVAQAAQLAANTAYNVVILALAETWPHTGKTKGEWNGAMWNEMMWNGSLLRENPASTPSYDTRFVLFQAYTFDPLTRAMLLRFSKYLTTRKPFSMPDGYKSDLWEFRLSGNMDIKSLKVAETHNALERV